MVNHHPTADFLTDYATGAMPPAQAACISGHVNYCEQCRRSIEQLQDIGGALLERLPPAAVSESVLDNVLARLDEPAPLSFDTSKRGLTDTAIPGLLQRLINGDFSELVWRKITGSLSVSYLKTGDEHHEFALYRIAAGGQIPEHDHEGSEMTLVLQGGFSDESGHYGPGDFVYRKPSETHAPTAIQSEECICLAVMDAPLRFTRWQHRWLNPFLQLRAG
ncbi:anti-sigm factor, ChrR [Luminiphilus syltensis NOR5-1B]|uniref:Anti-sigm factor, ChrR n=1 Tax=Luminiphilus syltensis NOR5-1B TaxID=565045 RepID=B8KUR1_9GAMM|nr:ChrR family anti-sigma-E factor [Luminiphilus syltensis]EED34090.1 anti-sigm factor, ChrR [Luminiphilus syltensis NOR5-1B]